jgi:hypothetical protein
MGSGSNDSDPYLTMNGYASTTTTYAGRGLSWMNNTIRSKFEE